MYILCVIHDTALTTMRVSLTNNSTIIGNTVTHCHLIGDNSKHFYFYVTK